MRSDFSVSDEIVAEAIHNAMAELLHGTSFDRAVAQTEQEYLMNRQDAQRVVRIAQTIRELE